MLKSKYLWGRLQGQVCRISCLSFLLSAVFPWFQLLTVTSGPVFGTAAEGHAGPFTGAWGIFFRTNNKISSLPEESKEVKLKMQKVSPK